MFSLKSSKYIFRLKFVLLNSNDYYIKLSDININNRIKAHIVHYVSLKTINL